MQCPNCENELRENARFCESCGNPVPPEQPPEGWFSCPKCGVPLPDEALFCHVCNEPVSVYAPPEGFVFDAESQRFYRSEVLEDGTQWVVWFDANSGEYEEFTYPAEPAPESASQPAIPEGFTHDPNSGLYYKTVPGTDPATGAQGTWVTWFYPETGEYKQQFHAN